MPFHSPAVSQLAVSGLERGTEQTRRASSGCQEPTQGRPKPDPAAPGRRCPGTLSTFLQTLAVPLPPQPILAPAACPAGGLLSRQVPSPDAPCHVLNSPEAPDVPSPGCQATPHPSRVATEWVPLRQHGRGSLAFRP